MPTIYPQCFLKDFFYDFISFADFLYDFYTFYMLMTSIFYNFFAEFPNAILTFFYDAALSEL
jgi:hypothetical protein